MEKSVTFNWKLDVCFICTRYLVLWSEGEWEFAADKEVSSQLTLGQFPFLPKYNLPIFDSSI